MTPWFSFSNFQEEVAEIFMGQDALPVAQLKFQEH